MLSAIFSGLWSAIFGFVLKIAELFGVYHAGEKAQATADDEASLKGAQDANTIRTQVTSDSDARLNAELAKRMRGAGLDK